MTVMSMSSFNVGDVVVVEHNDMMYSGTITSSIKGECSIFLDYNEGDTTIEIHGRDEKLIKPIGKFLGTGDEVIYSDADIDETGIVISINGNFALVSFDKSDRHVPLHRLSLVPQPIKKTAESTIYTHGFMLGNFEETHIGSARALQRMYLLCDKLHIGVIDCGKVSDNLMAVDNVREMVDALCIDTGVSDIDINVINILEPPPSCIPDNCIVIEGAHDNRASDYYKRWFHKNGRVEKVATIKDDDGEPISGENVKTGLITITGKVIRG